MKGKVRREEFSVLNIEKLGKDLSTFDLKGYEIEGEYAIHPITKEKIYIKDMYNEIRNVRNKKKEIIAKRKNPSDILCEFKSK